jgi:beta-1,4-mannooligosaccharide/beta-1,4-mannosyl-N-acetylglucosamine phosphorylase
MSEVKTLIRVGDRPLLTREDIPDIPPEIVDVSSVFNPGAVRSDNGIFLLLRVQTRGRRTFCLPAFSDDGLQFQVAPRSTEFVGLPELRVFHNYDARLTLLDQRLHVVTALDTDRGCRCALWLAKGDPAQGFAGLERLEFVSLVGDQDTRNAVLFPEKIGGEYLMLHRPNQTSLEGGPASGSAIHLCASDNLHNWQDRGPVMSGNFHFWDELIGSGPPPIKTRHGWLHLYHGVATHFQAASVYQVGAVLLDLENPAKVLSRTRDNILEPRKTWELTGQVPNVVFPSGAITDRTDDEGFAPDDAVLRVYYGAADTVVGLAESTVGQIVGACRVDPS